MRVSHLTRTNRVYAVFGGSIEGVFDSDEKKVARIFRNTCSDVRSSLEEFMRLASATCCVTDSSVFLNVKDVYFIDVLALFHSSLPSGFAMCTNLVVAFSHHMATQMEHVSLLFAFI